MRTTVEIPDEIYRELKIKAAREGKTVREIVLQGLQQELENNEKSRPIRKLKLPLIRSSRPGTLDLTNEQIDDILAS